MYRESARTSIPNTYLNHKSLRILRKQCRPNMGSHNNNIGLLALGMIAFIKVQSPKSPLIQRSIV